MQMHLIAGTISGAAVVGLGAVAYIGGGGASLAVGFGVFGIALLNFAAGGGFRR